MGEKEKNNLPLIDDDDNKFILAVLKRRKDREAKLEKIDRELKKYAAAYDVLKKKAINGEEIDIEKDFAEYDDTVRNYMELYHGIITTEVDIIRIYDSLDNTKKKQFYKYLKEKEPYFKTNTQINEYMKAIREFDKLEVHMIPAVLRLYDILYLFNEENKNTVNVTYNAGNLYVKAMTDKLANEVLSSKKPKDAEDGLSDGLSKEARRPLRYEKKGSKKEITLSYYLDFKGKKIEEHGLEMNFDDMDWFIVTALDNLYDDNNRIVSLTKIWREIGNTGTPSPKDIQEIHSRLMRGVSTTITIDDRDIRESWGGDTHEHTELTSQIMPIQISTNKIETTIIKGKITRGTVHITAHSPFYIIAQITNRKTSWKKEVLTSYKGRRTERYWKLMHYLMREIGWLRNSNSKRSNKLTLHAIYDYVGADTPKKRALTKKMTYDILEQSFVSTGYVKKYKEDEKDGNILLTVKKDKSSLIEKK